MSHLFITHHIAPKRATISYSGLKKPLRVYHFADTHLTLHDERDEAHLIHWNSRPDGTRPHRGADVLYWHLENATALGADIIVAGGDLFEFPSQANIECAQKMFQHADKPVLVVPGNHDWYFPGMEGWEPLRDSMIHRLHPLTNNSPSFRVVDQGGVRFVLVDNSTYHVSRIQVEATVAALHTDLPVILVLHIPVGVATLRQDVVEKHGSAIVMGDTGQPQQAERPTADRIATQDFIRTLMNANSLVAILAAHVHLPHVDAFGLSAAQYIPAAGYAGGHRLIVLTR